YLGDPDLLQQLVLILLDNAVKYSPAGTSVRVRLEEGEARYRLTIADSGPGIPKEARSRIFDRFYRVDASRSRASGGAGLGLPIARWIAALHGGSVELERSDDAGSTFTVTLPRESPLLSETLTAA
ncbi:MAG: sensor histidine kinase, partial [Acidobacteriota bacterium]|nr:sensor histidine kinase [Acidobacteriota bacterium]